MSIKGEYNYYNYYQILNKTIIRAKSFHLLINLLDTFLIIIKILNIYQTNYNSISDRSIKFANLSLLFSKYITIIQLLPIIIYLFMAYLISILYLFNIKKKANKFDMVIINFFEFILIRLLFIIYCEFLFNLNSFYYILFLILSLPFFIFIIIDMSIFHLNGFMLKIISFPFDDFTSLCDREKFFIKLLISISSIIKSFYICKLMFILQFLLLFLSIIYNTYILFYKSYYIMNNEFISKTQYSSLLCITIIQIFMFLMNPEEIFDKSFIIIIIFIVIFVLIFILLFYNPYKYIIIDSPDNRENVFYYFFLIDRNKNVNLFIEKKIKEHLFKCNFCPLCTKFQEFRSLNNVIEYENENNKEIDLFNILYNGSDKAILLYNHIIKSIKKLGNNSLYNNSYYIINLIYIFHYSLKMNDISFSLNQFLLYNLIQENNQSLISTHMISIKQILYINEFLLLYKKILSQIKDIISNNNNIKKHINKFFTLSKTLTILNKSRFKSNLFGSKREGVTNYTYLLTMCSLLYEELFNKAISSYSIPIRENSQLHEDILKNYFKNNNHIILDFNLKTIECKILNAGKELYYHINNNFYDLFPNQIKEILINNFCSAILNSKEKKIESYKKLKHNKKQYIETILLIKYKDKNTHYYRTLSLRLSLLFNESMKENIILNGYFQINKNILMTNQLNGGKERICGFGNNYIKKAVYESKLNLNNFKNSKFMKNKLIQIDFNISLNDNTFNIYNIIEIKKRKRKIDNNNNNNTFLKRVTSSKDSDNINYVNNSNKFLKNYDSGVIDDENGNNENISENDNDNDNNIADLNDILEETASQSSSITKNSDNSIWNLNKTVSREEQNNFSSKSFINLQILLWILLLALIILIISLVLKLKLLQGTISDYCQNYYYLRQFIRTFHQFSYSFLTIACIAKYENGTCEQYISKFDTEEFNQTLFIMLQNEYLAESCSDSISKIILNSETIQDQKLIDLLRGNISYHIMNIKKINDAYNYSHTIKNITLNDALLLLSNNMRIIISNESGKKSRDKEPIYLISGYNNPFENIKNNKEELSDYQIAVYTYLINHKLFILRFSSLNSRLSELINLKNQSLLLIFNILNTIIIEVMLLQIIVMLVYLLAFNKILAQIINSIITKMNTTYDNDNDFKKIFNIKIKHLETLVTFFSNNPINSINDINKNCQKYKSLISTKKKSEQKLNTNKKTNEEDDENLLFKDKQKYINWFEIYEKGYDRFYIIFAILITIIDFVVYIIITIIWVEYNNKSNKTLEAIYYSWNFERNTLRLVNFYHSMLFTNQTLEDITNDYFNDDNKTCIENILEVLNSYYELRKKRQSISDIYQTYDYFCDYDCKSLYDFINIVDTNSYSTAIKKIKEDYGKNYDNIKNSLIDQCEKSKSFIGASISPALQSIYQKIIDSMILLKERSYSGIINTIFNSSLPNISSVFLNVTRYIIYIFGKVTYSDATVKIIAILGSKINITLVLYILSSSFLYLTFLFIYIWNIHAECKNMFKLQSVFEVTNANEI